MFVYFLELLHFLFCTQGDARAAGKDYKLLDDHDYFLDFSGSVDEQIMGKWVPLIT